MFFITLLSFSTALTFLLTPLTIRLAKKFNLMDFPSRPHPAILHKTPIPRAGGLAVFLGLFLTIFFVFSQTSVLIDKKLVGIFLASAIIVIVGLLDDRYDLNPYFRLITNILAVFLVIGSGIGIQSFTNPVGGLVHLDTWKIAFSLPFLGSHTFSILADLLAFFWIVWIMNAVNWSSGIDGQLSGIAVIGFTVIGLVSLKSLGADPNQLITASLAFAAAGAYLGFLPWSFYPQKIMPGYGGSAFAGFLIATLSILSGAKLATAALVLAVPLADGIWAVLRRLYQRRSPVWGDRKHLHHQLLALGWSIPKIVLFYYLVTAVLGLVALSLNSRGKLFALVMVGLIFVGFLLTLKVWSKKISARNN